MSDVTRLLEAAAGGDRKAAADLLPVVYDEFRKLAAARLAAEAPGHSLNPTALVHEAYLRLIGDQQFDGCSHFFAAAAEARRRILVETARRKRSAKRGGGRARLEFEDEQLTGPEPREDLLALDEALNKLAALNREAADLVQLRYFAGLTLPEAAQALGISPRTAGRLWAYARAWLCREVEGAPDVGDKSG